MRPGSWDSEGRCSELGGGVHQICIKNIANNARSFSAKTGQSNWSDQRGSDNHCVCLGAWSLYVAKNRVKDNILQCDAIPENAFSNEYISKFSEGWNKWNGLELDNQIQYGVEELFKQCRNRNGKPNTYFTNKYCSFAKDIQVLRDSDLFRNTCKNMN